MTQSYSYSQSSQSPAPSYGPAVYIHPSDVTSDPKLTTAEKRAILTSWISDARAVEDAPLLRRLDTGAVAKVDEIRQALFLLDDPELDRKADGKRLNPSGRRRTVISRWLRRVDPLNGSNDNDDDPPPAPAGFSGFRFVPPLSPPMGELPKKSLGWRAPRVTDLCGGYFFASRPMEAQPKFLDWQSGDE